MGYLARHVLLAATTTATLGGCSLIYNPSNLPVTADAPVDAPIIDACLLELTDVGTTFVYEGQGEGGSRPAVVVIRGKNIAADATVEIRPAAGDVMFTYDRPTISGDFQWLAVSMTIPVDTNLAADVPLDIKVTQICNDVQFDQVLRGKLTLRGLKELNKDNLVVTGGLANTIQLDPLYSKIDLSDVPLVKWNGMARVELRSTSSIAVAGLEANGGNAGVSVAGVAGPGGCTGGGPSQKGLCPGGGGLGASSTLGAGGGGGGGFSSDGMSGAGTGGGSPGVQSGSPAIATYDGFDSFTPNRASGGGGGGNILVGMGGAGGGGAGTIELTAGGDVRATGTITAVGGDGDKSANLLNGSGGGGAGGVVVLRAGGTLTTQSINVAGGEGGGNNASGGKGAAGRIRWDAWNGTAPMSTEGSLHAGPAFDIATPVFVTPESQLTLEGSPSDSFRIYVVRHDGTEELGDEQVFGADRRALIQPRLQAGYNRVCITLKGGQKGKPEADKCIEVAYLP